MYAIKDDRRLIKYLDWEYHKQFAVSRKAIQRLESNKNLWVLRQLPGSGVEYCYSYFRRDDEELISIRPLSNLLTPEDISEMLSLFEKSWDITDEEWKFFCVMMPSVRSSLGKITHAICQIELHLSGSAYFKVIG